MTARKKENEIKQEQESTVSGVVVDTNGSVETQIATEPLPQYHVSVVIPYCKEFAQGTELLYALRSWQKYVRFGINIVVIGDREDWFSEEVTFIEHQRTDDNPQVDVLSKLRLAIESPEVTERFIWTNDDIYLCNPVSLAHIELPKVMGELSPVGYNGFYAENISRTMEMLDRYGLPKLNYGTHTPVLFEKFRLANMLAQFELSNFGILLSSLYFNFQPFPAHPVLLDWQTDQFLLPIVSKNPNEKKVTELLAHKVFLNNATSGYSPWLEDFLKRQFPEPSDFEE